MSAEVIVGGEQRTIEWWKSQAGYEPSPKYVSNREIRQAKKYWAKPDKYYLSELKAEEPELDDFKKGRVLSIGKKNDESKWEKPNSKPVADNVNYLREEPIVPKRRSHKSARFSDVYARPNKKAQQSQQS